MFESSFVEVPSWQQSILRFYFIFFIVIHSFYTPSKRHSKIQFKGLDLSHVLVDLKNTTNLFCLKFKQLCTLHENNTFCVLLFTLI